VSEKVQGEKLKFRTSMAEESEVAPDQETNQVWGGERSSRARISGSGVERVDWRVWM